MAIFAKTIDHGSFRGAASALNLSPSVVSHHVSQLERHLGIALIYRSTRKLALTPDGARVLAASRKMLEAVEAELQDISASAGEPRGALRVTLPSVLSQSKLIEKISTFSERYPRVELSLDFSDSRRELIQDGFDIAILMTATHKKSTTSRKLFTVECLVVASASYLADRSIRRAEDVLDLDWLKLMPVQNMSLDLVSAEGQTHTIKPEAKLFTNDAQSLYRLARADAGVAIVPDFLASADMATGHMVSLLPELRLGSIDVFAEWPANAPKHGLVHLLLDALG